jgi:tRNA(adenine34) deaminase
VKKTIRTSVLCLENNSILVFKATDPKSKDNFYFLPGGKVQQKEDLLTCARREFLEETGLSLKNLFFSNHTSHYIQVWNGNENSCQTSYYIAEIDYNIPPIEIEECSYHNGIEWLPLEKLYTAFSFNKKILSDLEFLVAQGTMNGEALKLLR